MVLTSKCNKKEALNLLSYKIKAYELELQKKEDSKRWHQHYEVERGNPIRTFRGSDFKKMKVVKGYKSQRLSLKNDLKNIAYKFSDNIKVCYANEYYSKDSHIVATIKHTLGFPTSIFIDGDKNVIDVKHFTYKTKLKTPIKEVV